MVSGSTPRAGSNLNIDHLKSHRSEPGMVTFVLAKSTSVPSAAHAEVPARQNHLFSMSRAVRFYERVLAAIGREES